MGIRSPLITSQITTDVSQEAMINHILHTSVSTSELHCNKMTTRKTFILYLALFFILSVMRDVSGFQTIGICGPKCGLQRSTVLGVAEKKPRWTELPRVRQSQAELSGFEINTGRVAMVGFCGLLAREISSGESFGQQLFHVISVASGVDLHI